MKVLLASASPRRRDLLRQIGWEAVIRPVDFAERQAGDPDAVCLGNARGKAADAAAVEKGLVRAALEPAGLPFRPDEARPDDDNDKRQGKDKGQAIKDGLRAHRGEIH